ncbi:MAG: SGNH/GDSL hydrolase family protein [Planctomycetes bacterium]|nr:SGNH/GDSL hydrolase family protein [Planctomycetota bacterium]
MLPHWNGSHRVRRRALRVLAAATATLAALGIAELALRVAAGFQNRSTLEAAWSEARTLPPGSKARLIDLIRPSLDELAIYELRPGLGSVEFKGAPVTTNRHGFRGAELDPEPGPDTVTLIGLGDSLMFGHGVGDDEPYLAVLERRLNATRPERVWRTVNTAAPGYNTVMEVATLRSRALAFRPDIVILGLCANDYAPPEYVRLAEDPTALDTSFLLELVRGATHSVAASEPRDFLTHKSEWEAEFASLPGRVPPRYRATVGVEAFRRALDQLAELSKEHGFRVLAFATYEYRFTDEMLAAARERGFAVSSLMRELEAQLRREGAAGFDEAAYRRSSLVVGPGNAHPSALQHRMAAEHLLGELERLGWLDRPIRHGSAPLGAVTSRR